MGYLGTSINEWGAVTRTAPPLNKGGGVTEKVTEWSLEI